MTSNCSLHVWCILPEEISSVDSICDKLCMSLGRTIVFEGGWLGRGKEGYFIAVSNAIQDEVRCLDVYPKLYVRF